jgi:hypothetical protein
MDGVTDPDDMFKNAMATMATRAVNNCSSSDKVRWPSGVALSFYDQLRKTQELVYALDRYRMSMSLDSYDKAIEQAADVIVTVMSAMASLGDDGSDRLAKAIVDKILLHERRDDHV